MNKLILSLAVATIAFTACKKEEDAPIVVVVPTLTTTAVTDITPTSATSGVTVSSDGKGTVTESGICWNVSPNPTTALTTKTTGASGFINGLTVNTTYYVRAYATNSAGTAYGSELTFKTDVSLLLTTTPVSAILKTTATSGVTVKAGTAATKGICWGTSPTPTAALTTRTVDGTGAMDKLTAGTKYYVRAYAVGTDAIAVYGDELSFTTIELGVPTVTTTLTSNTSASFSLSGTISDDDGLGIKERGFVYGFSSGVTTGNAAGKASSGTGIGTISQTYTNSFPKSTYYFKTYAISTKGITYYGNEVKVTTL